MKNQTKRNAIFKGIYSQKFIYFNSVNKNEKSNLKNNYIIRCDASLFMGNGHVIRCRSLARYLRKRSINSIFFCRALDGNLIKLTEDEFQTIVLEKPKNKEILYSSNYSEMLGVKQEIDAKEVIYEIEKNKIVNWRKSVVNWRKSVVNW